MNKKGNAVILIIAVVGLLIIFAQIFDLAARECSLDKDCDDESYCGSDYKCHKHPTISKYNYVPAAFIIGISLIIAAYLLKRKST